MIESNFQSKLKKEIKDRFPGCYILKNDPTIIQGIPDLTILYKDRWAALEVKKDERAYKASLKKNPNQQIHVDRLNQMSYAAFIYPENKEEILNELERSFKTKRNTSSV